MEEILATIKKIEHKKASSIRLDKHRVKQTTLIGLKKTKTEANMFIKLFTTNLCLALKESFSLRVRKPVEEVRKHRKK